MEKIVERKTWKEFRETGLLLIINQILHIFGWAIVVNILDEDGSIVEVYPARTKWRGFSEKNSELAYVKLTEYMKNNISELQEDVQ